MGRLMCADEMQLMVWVSSEWSHEWQKAVATVAADLFKGLSYLKTPCVCEADKLKVYVLGFSLPLKTFRGYLESGCW